MKTEPIHRPRDKAENQSFLSFKFGMVSNLENVVFQQLPHGARWQGRAPLRRSGARYRQEIAPPSQAEGANLYDVGVQACHLGVLELSGISLVSL